MPVAWSIATVLCGLATGFYALLALRMLVGVGESVIYPANARFVAEHARVDQRGFANGAISASMFLGPVAGTLIGGLVLASYGWRAVFIVLGVASLVWLVPWFATPLPADRHIIAGTPRPAPPRWADIIGQPRFWGVAIGHLVYCYPAYLLLTWLPSFLVNAQHYTLAQMAVMGALVPGFSAIGCMISGLVQTARSPPAWTRLASARPSCWVAWRSPGCRWPRPRSRPMVRRWWPACRSPRCAAGS